MSWIRSLTVAAIFGIGIALVMWLVSLITGETGFWMSGILTTVFFLIWFWTHRGLNDTELHPHHHSSH